MKLRVYYRQNGETKGTNVEGFGENPASDIKSYETELAVKLKTDYMTPVLALIVGGKR